MQLKEIVCEFGTPQTAGRVVCTRVRSMEKGTQVKKETKRTERKREREMGKK